MRVLSGGRLHSSAGDIVSVYPLQDISLDIRGGDRVALIGPNGAGKSTLLRLIAGIYAPTEGVRRVDGEIGSLLELGGTMEPDLSARENIKRAAVIDGIDKRSLDKHLQEVEDFVSLGRFFDLPVRTLSSGMLMRVAFATSTLRDPEILLIDEIFGAGDEAFQLKAQRRMELMIEQSKILLFSSHSMDLLKRFCNKGLFLNEGRVAMFGAIDEVINCYSDTILEGKECI